MLVVVVDELLQQVDLSEATHCVVEEIFASKMNDVKRRTAQRGNPRIRQVRTLQEILCTSMLQRKESFIGLLKTNRLAYMKP